MMALMTRGAVTNDGTGTGQMAAHICALPKPMPVLLVPCAAGGPPEGEDRYRLAGAVTVGRKAPSDITVDDWSLSRAHFRLSVEAVPAIEDLGSKNGTFVNGHRVTGQKELDDGAVIRAGRCLFVFHEDGGDLLEKAPPDTFGMAGPFHTAPLVRRLTKLSLSKANVLLTGPSGAGKELAARAYARLLERDLVVHNAAAFATEDQAAATLFGLGDGVFTGVPGRGGLIQEAHRKVLFLDETHHLPERVQSTLLRALEERRINRIGETAETEVDVKIIEDLLGTDADGNQP